MFTYQLFGPSADLTEGAVYRFRTAPSNLLTLVTKRRGVVYVMGWGNGTQRSMSCDEWDRLYTPGRRRDAIHD
jgi:hypothetical protein